MWLRDVWELRIASCFMNLRSNKGITELKKDKEDNNEAQKGQTPMRKISKIVKINSWIYSKKAGGHKIKTENGKQPGNQRITDLVDDCENCTLMKNPSIILKKKATKRTPAPEKFVHNGQLQKKNKIHKD